MTPQGYPLRIRSDHETYIVVGWINYGNIQRPVVLKEWPEDNTEAFLLETGTVFGVVDDET